MSMLVYSKLTHKCYFFVCFFVKLPPHPPKMPETIMQDKSIPSLFKMILLETNTPNTTILRIWIIPQQQTLQ